MKTQTRAIIASVVVIALALSAISGVTYSWFSDTEDFKFDVTTGQIEMNFENDSVPVVKYSEYPYNTERTELISEWTNDGGVYSANINSALLKDKDKLIIDVPNITINNTIKANYYEQILIKEDNTEVTDPFFVIEGLNTVVKQYEPNSESANIVDAHEITIVFDSDGAAQGKTYTISIIFTAIQSNAPITVSNGDDLVKTIGACSGNVSINVIKDIPVTESIKISEGKNVTLNIDDNVALSCKKSILFDVDGGSLTINGGVLDVVSPFTGVNGSSIVIEDTVINSTAWAYIGKSNENYSSNDSIKLINVTMDTKGDNCIGAFKGATVTISGGKYTSNFGCVFLTNGSPGLAGQIWNIEGATFNVNQNGYDKNDAISVGIQCHNGDVWNIKNCIFYVEDGVAISVRGGDVSIDGCRYDFTTTDGHITSGMLKYTSTKADTEVSHGIVTYYKDGSYGCDENTKLTINNISVDVIKDGTVRYPAN